MVRALVVFLLEENAPHNDRPEAWQEPVVGGPRFPLEYPGRLLFILLCRRVVDSGQPALGLEVLQSGQGLAPSIDALEVLVQRLHL